MDLQPAEIVRATAKLISALSTLSIDEALEHFDVCWQKSVGKGDFGKMEDVPGEIADCIISLQWLASLQEIELPSVQEARETQASVSQWCDEHYPGEDLKQRTLNLIEELAELLVCQGAAHEKNRQSLQNNLCPTPTDELLTLYNQTIQAFSNYANFLGASVGNMLDQKMVINRRRTEQDSARRLRTKNETMENLAPS